MNKIYYLWMLIFACFTLLGCEREEIFTDLKQHIDQVKQSKATRYQERQISTIQLPPPLIYQMASTRSPFQSTTPTATKTKRSSNPLQTYSVSMLRFVGTLSSGKQTIGYVLAPNNLIYTVKQGDLIGTEGGIILDVLPKTLKILETGLENGKRVRRMVTLQLKDER